MAPELGVSELPLTNYNINESKEMETEDIEDGEILEDESNDGEEPPCEVVKDSGHPAEKNNFEPLFFNKEKRSHHHHPHVHRESHKSIRRDRSSFSLGLKKRKRSDDDAFRSNKFYGKKIKRSDAEDENDEDMIFMLGGTLQDVERKTKSSKSTPVVPGVPEDILDPMAYNEGENEDPRPYARRSPTERRDKMKKDRGLVRGVASGLLKRRRGRGGGPISRKEKQRESANDICSFFAQGKCLRGTDCPYLHPYSQPRKLEICKFYLNDCCTKREKCIYMHGDFPCKYFHLPGLTCSIGTKCKFSHSKLDEVQRAVLKKYTDVPMKEIDEMQRFYRETANGAFSSRSKEKKDSRIPSLFDIKVSVPPEFRGNEGQEGDGVTTPIPSPESMVYENDNSEEKPHKHHHKHSKILAEHNDYKHDFFGEGVEPTVPEITSKHKKKSRKSDEFSDGDRSRKHGEKKKKKSKKEDKDGEKAEKRKKKKDKRNKSENIEDAFAVGGNNTLHEDAFEVTNEEKTEREPADAFAHLPKKQQELFLRIQQHQKEADTSQNANVDQENEEDDSKADVNWYSSDEDESPEPVQETTSPLATLLRTIQSSSSSTNSSSSNVPSTEKKVESIPVPTHLFSNPSAAIAENESVPIVDASQLANIDLSDEVTKILTSIMKTETGSTYSDTISNSLPSDTEKNNDRMLSSSSSVSRKTFPTSGMERLPFVPTRKASSEDLGSIFRNAASFGVNTPSNNDSSPKDIDLRQLPFKPVPVHDAANEIDASITSHPPMEYKLRPLPSIPKVNYAAMIDAARNCARDDPRFKRKAPVIIAEPTVDLIVKPTDTRFDMKTHSESALRADPRIRNDPRLAASKNIPAMTTTVPTVPSTKADPRMEKESVRTTDFRDPRLLTCNKFPPEGGFSSYQMAAVAAAAAAAAVSSLPQSVSMLAAKEPTSLRKEDPRLRFRTNQNA